MEEDLFSLLRYGVFSFSNGHRKDYAYFCKGWIYESTYKFKDYVENDPAPSSASADDPCTTPCAG